jgi:putative flippase GtrA
MLNEMLPYLLRWNGIPRAGVDIRSGDNLVFRRHRRDWDRSWARTLLARLVSLASATLVSWRINRALTFERSGRHQGDEGMRYSAVTADAQGTSYAVFAALALTVVDKPPLVSLIAGAAVGALVRYNGHRLCTFGPWGALLRRWSRV